MGMEKNVNSSILDFYILGARAEHRPDFVKETFLVFYWQMMHRKNRIVGQTRPREGKAPKSLWNNSIFDAKSL
jgi:hypothetical protein